MTSVLLNWSQYDNVFDSVAVVFSQQEAEYTVHEQIDLYDDVISPSANNGDAPEDRDYLDALPAPGGSEAGKSAPPNVVYTYTGKRIALYIGNLRWVGVNHLDDHNNFCTVPNIDSNICVEVVHFSQVS